MRIPEFIQKTDKSLSPPPVVTTELKETGGFYSYPRKEECRIENKYYDMSRGIIVLSTHRLKTERDLLSTLAHEWRHYWQKYNGEKEDKEGRSGKWYYKHFDLNNYEESIYKYFTIFPEEMDAFLFQIRMVGITEGMDNWIRILLERSTPKRKEQIEYALHSIRR